MRTKNGKAYSIWLLVVFLAIILISDGSEAATGKWRKDKTGYWYSYPDGSYARNEWIKDKNRWYYLNEKGYVQTGWKKLSGKWYYFAGSGAMQTGWKKLSGKWYYFAGSGAMQTGWKKLSGKWYYFAGSGVMRTGWKKLSGKWYYFTKSGEMVTGWIVIDNVQYHFGDDGVMQEETLSCNHQWVEEEIYVEPIYKKTWIVDEPATTIQEPVYKEITVTILFDTDGSKWYYYDESEKASIIKRAGGTHYDENGNIVGNYEKKSSYVDYIETGEYKTVEIPEVGHYENKLVGGDYWKKTGKKSCRICGEVKE